MSPTIDRLTIGDEPEAWRRAGFTIDGSACRVGSVSLDLVGRAGGAGVRDWSLRDASVPGPDVDGLPTSAGGVAVSDPAPEHPLGALYLDHLVLMTPHLARTTAALEAVGLDVRRVREFSLGDAPMQQVFFRMGEVVLELVGASGVEGDGPASFWGLTFAVADLDAAASYLGDACGRVKDAVQPGRRIATVRTRDLGISPAVALMSLKP